MESAPLALSTEYHMLEIRTWPSLRGARLLLQITNFLEDLTLGNAPRLFLGWQPFHFEHQGRSPLDIFQDPLPRDHRLIPLLNNHWNSRDSGSQLCYQGLECRIWWWLPGTLCHCPWRGGPGTLTSSSTSPHHRAVGLSLE